MNDSTETFFIVKCLEKNESIPSNSLCTIMDYEYYYYKKQIDELVDKGYVTVNDSIFINSVIITLTDYGREECDAIRKIKEL